MEGKRGGAEIKRQRHFFLEIVLLIPMSFGLPVEEVSKVSFY